MENVSQMDQSFQPDFNELLVVLIALELIEIPYNSYPGQIIYESPDSFGKIEIKLCWGCVE
jgi:hypothetical protein